MIFDKGLLKNIFEIEMINVAGNWRKVHNKESPDLYFSSVLFEWSNQGTRIGGIWEEHGREKKEIWSYWMYKEKYY